MISFINIKLKALVTFLKSIKHAQHKVLLFVCIVSFLLSFCVYIFSIVLSKSIFFLLFGLIAFIPFFMTKLVYSVSNKTFEKFPLITKIVSAILNIYIIFGIQPLFIFGIMGFSGMWGFELKTFTDQKDYKEALKYVCYSEYAKHFPKEIPTGARNVKLSKVNSCWGKGDSFSLYLESDRDFIIDSLRGINCIEKEGPYKNKDEYKHHTARDFAVQHVNIEKTNLMFCAIGADDDIEEHGIAVDYKNNRILFYSIALY